MEMRTGTGQVPGEAGLPSSKGAPQEGHQRGLTLCLVKLFSVVFILRVYLYVHKTYPSGTSFPVQGLHQEWGPLSNTVEVEVDVSGMVGPPKGFDKQILQSTVVKDDQVSDAFWQVGCRFPTGTRLRNRKLDY